MPAALSAWVCLALNVTAACHLLLLPPRGSLPPAAHSRASDTGQPGAGNEGDPRVDLGGGFCAAGLSVADAVRWPCSSQHRRRATGAVLASAGGMAEHCGGAMEVGGGVDPRPWSFHRRHLLPVACALSPSPPLRLSASPPLLEHKSPSPPFRAPPPQAHHASPFAPTPHCHFTTLLAFLPSSFPHSSASPFAPPPPQQQATGGAGGAGRKLGGSGRWEAEREKGVGGEAAAEGWRGARRQGEQSAGRGRGAHCWGRGGWRGGVGGWDVRPAVPPGRCGVKKQMAGPGAGPSQAGPSEAGPSEAGPSEDGPSQAGPSQAGPSQAGPSQAGPSQAGPSQAGPSQAGPSQAGSGRPAPPPPP
ncbi:unnamed protein product [Closterium sp. NIES-53]